MPMLATALDMCVIFCIYIGPVQFSMEIGMLLISTKDVYTIQSDFSCLFKDHQMKFSRSPFIALYFFFTLFTITVLALSACK